MIIAGCGRAGSLLAAQLAAEGHDVRIVDRVARTRRLLPAGFPGRFHVGNVYSRTVLEAAGVEHADAFVAVTSGDNSNIVSARTAKETYRVPIVLVLAHVYAPAAPTSAANSASPPSPASAGRPTVPAPGTRLQPGDELLVVSHAATEQEIHAAFQ
ncbi:hypothetical protein GCM10027162_52970 [Streptomyces incanus]